jgi:3-isopropylmalate dehydrogenase
VHAATAGPGPTSAFSEAIEGRHPPDARSSLPAVIGVLPGQGIGPEVTAAAIRVLSALDGVGGRSFEVRYGPPAAVGDLGSLALTDHVTDFCRDTFAHGGAVLAGAHGGRWVYELRRRFDLFCRINPLRPPAEIDDIAGPLRPRALRDVDVAILREQSAGIYQGRWSETDGRSEGHIAEHSFSYSRREVQRIVDVAARLARRRRGRLTAVLKEAGIPSISRLWRDCAQEAADEAGIAWEAIDVDFAAYRLIQDPRSFDVVVAPNLFGDVLSDVGSLLLGSRGLGHGGSFDAGRAAVFQTNHGAAYDLAGRDRANPAGQILSAAMMLRESFGAPREAALIEDSLSTAWRQGWRTEDLAEPGCRIVGTREMADRVVEAMATLAGAPAASGS